MADTDDRDSIRIKIRGAEFEARGDKQSVDARFAAFMTFAEKMANKGDALEEDVIDEKPEENNSTPKREEMDMGDLRRRAFRVDGDLVSLNALPQGEGQQLDTVILILYARMQLLNEASTLIGALLDGVKQSGLRLLVNIARVVDGSESLVTKAGIKRGTRYGLTNQGINRAEEALRKMYA